MNFESKKIITQLKPHSRKIITEAEKVKKKIITGLFEDESPKRELIEGITIDGKYSKDLDDGVWAEKTKNGYSVFISIADVSEYIQPNTLLDLQASKNTVSKYLNTHVFHMFPQILSTEVFSLNGGKKSLTQTLRVDLDNDFRIKNLHNFESIFYNKKRYDYEEFSKDFSNPDSDNFETLQLLYHISQGLKHNRVSQGGNANFKECVTLKLDSKCKENSKKNIAQDIISELALLRNIESAKKSFKEKISIIYRGYRPELENKITGNLATNKGFFNFKPTHHAGLKQGFYTYDTSPIRRYSDLITQRQIKANLRKQEEVYNLTQIRKIAYNLNTSIDKILKLQKQHNHQVNIKRAERLLKKLEEDNFKNLGTIAQKTFYYLIKHLINNRQYLLSYGPIQEEIIYRINNAYLDRKTIALLRSAPKNTNNIDLFKEIIKLKQSENEIY